MPPNYPEFYSPLETMPRDQLAQLQRVRLLATVKKTYKESPLFRELMLKAGVSPENIQSTDDFFTKVPMFDKDDIRAYRDKHKDPCGGLLEADNPQITTLLTSSGTTGDPTPIPVRYESMTVTSNMGLFWGAGARPGDYVISAGFNFRMSVGTNSAFKDAGLIPIHFNHDPAEWPRMIAALKQYRPTIFAPLSGPLLLGLETYLETSDEDPKDFFSSLKGVMFGGEALSPRMKALTEEWGLTLYEVGPVGDMVLGCTCEAADGYHAWEDMAYVECLHPITGNPVVDGEIGELVVTNINDPLFAMVRFRTDDLVTVNRSPCSCGRTHLRIKIVGRKSDQIIVQGKAILPIDIRFHIEKRTETSGGLFQIIKTASEMDVCAVRVGFSPDKLSTTKEALINSIERELSDLLTVPVRVELTPEAELLKLGPPHKIPRVTKQ